jgi:hypothetical protein
MVTSAETLQQEAFQRRHLGIGSQLAHDLRALRMTPQQLRALLRLVGAYRWRGPC